MNEDIVFLATIPNGSAAQSARHWGALDRWFAHSKSPVTDLQEAQHVFTHKPQEISSLFCIWIAAQPELKEIAIAFRNNSFQKSSFDSPPGPRFFEGIKEILKSEDDTVFLSQYVYRELDTNWSKMKKEDLYTIFDGLAGFIEKDKVGAHAARLPRLFEETASSSVFVAREWKKKFLAYLQDIDHPLCASTEKIFLNRYLSVVKSRYLKKEEIKEFFDFIEQTVIMPNTPQDMFSPTFSLAWIFGGLAKSVMQSQRSPEEKQSLLPTTAQFKTLMDFLFDQPRFWISHPEVLKSLSLYPFSEDTDKTKMYLAAQMCQKMLFHMLISGNPLLLKSARLLFEEIEKSDFLEEMKDNHLSTLQWSIWSQMKPPIFPLKGSATGDNVIAEWEATTDIVESLPEVLKNTVKMIRERAQNPNLPPLGEKTLRMSVPKNPPTTEAWAFWKSTFLRNKIQSKVNSGEKDPRPANKKRM